MTTSAARDALTRLCEGNRRFTSRLGSARVADQRVELVAEQRPYAVILGCSDSRVPPEIVFDEGLGDLFVIRVAGNIVGPSQLASAEFAASRFGTPLLVVLGHSSCGAVAATLEAITAAEDDSDALAPIVDAVRPSVETLAARDDPDVLEQAVKANICASVQQLRDGSAGLTQLVEDGRLVIVGAHYSVATGIVEFFDGTPEATNP